ncbi:MAG: phospholipase D family protein [Campylobacterota bacterium]|nr:phospholipase D family protein [Campylobacterota bacterium]
MNKEIMKLIFIAIALILMLSSCSSKYVTIAEDREANYSVQSAPLLYEYAQENIFSYAPKSGFYPLINHVDSFSARLLLAQAAKKKIRLQYFTYDSDYAGKILFKALYDAANRGVKVEFLIDDIELSYRDKIIAAVNSHENITVRVFNPTNSRGSFHFIDIAFHSDSLGRRMHNKAFIVDNSMAVFGGRNIGDKYLGMDKKDFYIDNDMLVVGPFVNKINNEFEHYFSSKYSVDFNEIAKMSSKHRLEKGIKKIHEILDSKYYKAFMKTMNNRAFVKAFRAKKTPFYFADAELYFDLPNKIESTEHNSSVYLRNQVDLKFTAQKSLHIANPYFIPDEDMFDNFASLREKGVEITVVTNSLESTDSKAVFAYYSQKIERLIKMGIKIYEIHPYAFREALINQPYNLKRAAPNLMIHGKIMIIDEKYFVIGSRNMDPRSRFLNTELIAMIDSEEVAIEEEKAYRHFFLPENTYKLSLQCENESHSGCVVVREAIINGEKVRFEGNDNVGIWEKIKLLFVTGLPIEELL